tara:strand:- start:576 stop:743 length:168 start_codon:yes stop_codon:yes gene_type:complete
MTKKQATYLLRLINRRTGKAYRFLSQVAEDNIGKRMNKVRGINSAEASALIDEWK